MALRIIFAIVVLTTIIGLVVWRSVKLGTFRAVVSDLLLLLSR